MVCTTNKGKVNFSENWNKWVFLAVFNVKRIVFGSDCIAGRPFKKKMDTTNIDIH